MMGKEVAGAPGQGLHEREVVLGRDDRDMPHVCCEGRELGLHIDPGPVPAQQGIVGKAMPHVVNSWKLSRAGTDPGALEQAAKPLADPSAGVGSQTPVAVAEQRSVRSVRQPPARFEISFHFAGPIARERHESRFVELGGPDTERTLQRLVVGEGQADELSAPKARRVKQHEGEAEHFGSKR